MFREKKELRNKRNHLKLLVFTTLILIKLNLSLVPY